MQRPEYDHGRFLEYLNHIKFPNHYRIALVGALIRHQKGLPPGVRDIFHDDNIEVSLEALRSLQQYQLATVPFENLSLHYSQHKTISLDTNALFQKIVTLGHGGYCLENNCFFGTVLRTLGYTVYSAGARVDQGAGLHTGWGHMVNIVTLTNGERYLVDVGFGNNGPTLPLLLRDGHEEQGITPASMRLVREKIPETTNPNDRLWVYQHRASLASDWESFYCFTETEFLPSDYEVMNFWMSQNRISWFTYRIMCVKQVMDRGELVGTLILKGAEVKKRIGNKMEHLRTCQTEDERVEVLKNVFGVKLTEEEREGIRGVVTELPTNVAE